MNVLFASSTENYAGRVSAYRMLSSKSRNKRLQYYHYWEKVFDQPTKRILELVKKLETPIGQGENKTVGCLLNYPYFRKRISLLQYM